MTDNRTPPPDPPGESPGDLSPVPTTTAETEHQFHHYTGNRIPWYVRLMWLGFWVFAVAYAVRLLFPALQAELFERP